LNDPAAVVGVDKNQNIPQLAGATEVQVQAQPQPDSPISADFDNAMNVDNKNVTIVVLDGIVMGPMVIFSNIIIYIINTNLVFIALCY
jgi:hypothetical protein